MPSKHHDAGLKIRRLSIKNYKALDLLEIDFPPPRFSGDPDIFVLGSKNGIGKTSVLEACAMLFVSQFFGTKTTSVITHPEISIDVPDLMIRSGAREAIIEGDFVLDSVKSTVSIRINRKGGIKIENNIQNLNKYIKRPEIMSSQFIQRYIYPLLGFSPEPLMADPFLYFNSYRKVGEGSPEFGMLLNEDWTYAPRRSRSFRYDLNFPISTVKFEILRSLMGQVGLFENLEDSEAEETLSVINMLMDQYAGGVIEKLRPSSDNTIEFRIFPRDGGPSFSFDGLSSGQKEIISTLFLIWRHTRLCPGLVLIDEPELHLNYEWHKGVIRQLHGLSPNNQYILATHSEDVFGAVDPEHRAILEPRVTERAGSERH